MVPLVGNPERSTTSPCKSMDARNPPWSSNPSPTCSRPVTNTFGPNAVPREGACLNKICGPGRAPENSSKATLTAPEGEKVTWEPWSNGKFGETLHCWSITVGELQVDPPFFENTNSMATLNLPDPQSVPLESKSV